MPYGFADAQIIEACDPMRDVIVRRLSALGSIAAAARRVVLADNLHSPPCPSSGAPPMNDSLSIVLFSGTSDKLHAAGTIAAGAAAMGRPVNVLLMYWALDAFQVGPDREGPRARL